MIEDHNIDDPVEEQEQPDGRRLLYRIIGVLFVSAAIILAVYGVVAYSAWLRGQNLNEEKAQSALEKEIENQLNLAEEDIRAGNNVLAIRRIEWVLEQDSLHPGAGELRLLAQVTPIPSATITQAPTPSRTPAIIVEEAGPIPEEEYERLQGIIEKGDWSVIVTALTEFQSQFPNHLRDETDKMLYEAYIELGQELVNGVRVELGLSYFARAEQLGNLPLEVEDQRIWAELYLVAIGFYGVDWGAAVLYFRDLCAAAPFFQEACVKFHEALLAYGNQYAASLDWCPAEALYREAYTLDRSRELGEVLQGAGEECAEATPTPTPTLEGEKLPEGTPTPRSE